MIKVIYTPKGSKVINGHRDNLSILVVVGYFLRKLVGGEH
jgi:hypothetical protein